jgi:hypothetical protein
MSAYVCHDDTFDYLASATELWGRGVFGVSAAPGMPDVPALMEAGVLGGERQKLTSGDAEAIAQILRAENIRSVCARYGDDGAADAPYRFRRVPLRALDPAAVLKSCDCLEYQSCETDDYHDTLAWRVLNAIRRLAIGHLPGYEKAPWGWTRQAIEQTSNTPVLA